MLTFFLFKTLFAFELSIAQNFKSSLDAGNSITFDLYRTDGKSVPSTTELYDVTLLDGSGNMNSAKTVATLASGLSQTTGISVTLPSDLSSGQYFLGLIAESGSKYSGVFNVNGSDSTSDNKKGADSLDSSTSQLENFIILSITINVV
eukprot:NODE_127_length_18646_cov_0.421632.p10 type:complete len:148 gc:universal NODE_127_length_18646_cov_0.421632:7412-7855(+)